MTAPRRPLRALALMTVAGALFAGMNALAHGATRGAPVTVVAGTRALLGALLAFGVAVTRGAKPLKLLSQSLLHGDRRMWGRTVFGTAAMACTFTALADRRLPLGDAATLFNLSPLLVAALAPFALGEETDRRLAITLPVTIAGVLAVLRPPFLGLAAGASPPLASCLVAVAAAVFASVAMVLLRSTGGRATEAAAPVEAVALHFSVFAAIAFFGAAALRGEFTHVPLREAAPGMVGAGLCAGSAQLFMTAAYREDDAARVASLGYLNVPMSALLGALVAGERPAAVTVLGMVLVVGAGVATALGAGR